MPYLDVIKSSPWYFAIVIFALIVGALTFVFTNRRKENFSVNLVVFIVASLASIVFSLAVSGLLSIAYSRKTEGYRSVFSIFYAFVSFFPCAMILKKTVSDEVDIIIYLSPILIAIFLSRIACLTEGCCQGKIYAVYIEMLLVAILIIYNAVKRNLTCPVVIIIYTAWRFIAEFFKDAYTYEKLGVLTPVQYISLLAILLSILFLTLIKKENSR